MVLGATVLGAMIVLESNNLEPRADPALNENAVGPPRHDVNPLFFLKCLGDLRPRIGRPGHERNCPDQRSDQDAGGDQPRGEAQAVASRCPAWGSKAVKKKITELFNVLGTRFDMRVARFGNQAADRAIVKSVFT